MPTLLLPGFLETLRADHQMHNAMVYNSNSKNWHPFVRFGDTSQKFFWQI